MRAWHDVRNCCRQCEDLSLVYIKQRAKRVGEMKGAKCPVGTCQFTAPHARATEAMTTPQRATESGKLARRRKLCDLRHGGYVCVCVWAQKKRVTRMTLHVDKTHPLSHQPFDDPSKL